MESRLQSKEIHIPKPDFDLTNSAAPCQYFKSSFARSLSFSSNKAKSLDFCINFGIAKGNHGPSSISEESPSTINEMIIGKENKLMGKFFSPKRNKLSEVSKDTKVLQVKTNFYLLLELLYVIHMIYARNENVCFYP